ncbi:MAG: hypothetical protein ACE37H_04725 [Phycisphaeraceae bacterium]
MKRLPTLATLALVGLVGMPALGQSRSERVDQLTNALAGAAETRNTTYVKAETGQSVRATPRQLMRETLTNVDYDEMPAKLALDVWSNRTGVPLVVNWASLEAEGVDPDSPVTLKLKAIPAEQVLGLIVSQMHPDPLGDDELIVDVEQWYVRIMTKRDALRRSTTRMYFIGDLLMTIPNFDNAPGFDLNEALSNTNSGGSNGGQSGGGTLFGENNNDRDREPQLSTTEKAERIADVIRDSIEPDIWRENGGEYASIRYFRGMLVVKAPDFVHEQIGVPVTSAASERRTTSSSRSNSNNANKSNDHRPRRSSSGNVAGTQRRAPQLVR